MIKVYCPNASGNQVGGGWTFLRNFRKGLEGKVIFVETWQECDVLFISSVTMTQPSEVHAAKAAGKRIVFRVDNVPRKSRNKRSTPHERMKEFGKLADVVIYQSKWAKQYCEPLSGPGFVIYNGVDTKIFKNNNLLPSRIRRYLFAYHGKNELKAFWQAHYFYQLEHRKHPNSTFWFIYDFGSELPELQRSNFDFWNGENYVHLPKVESAEDMANIMRQCTHFIYPAFADASPNVVLEARASGLEVMPEYTSAHSGTRELLEANLDISIERMCDEYLEMLGG